MHVALNGYFWDQPRTGSGQYLRHLWAALRDLPARSMSHSEDARDTFSLLLPPGHPQPACHEGTSQGAHSHIAPGRGLPLLGGRIDDLDKLYWEEWETARLAKQQRAQLLHVPYLTAPAPLPGVRSCPVVVTAHDMIPWVIPGYGGSAVARLYFALALASVKRAQLILADSEASRLDAIRVLHVPTGRVRTVYLGVEQHEKYSRQELDDVRARYKLPQQYAFYLGGFDSRKNVPLLLRVWREVSDTLHGQTGKRPVLAIGGHVPPPGGVHPDVMGEAQRLGLAGPVSPVRFIGRVSEEDKPLLMAAARLFVYPSAYEGFGLDPLEAMSVGCVVVSSSGGSLKEVVGDGGLLVPPGDEQELARAVICAWQESSLRVTLSRRGRERAKQFTWQRAAEQTRRLYGEVLERRKRER